MGQGELVREVIESCPLGTTSKNSASGWAEIVLMVSRKTNLNITFFVIGGGLMSNRLNFVIGFVAIFSVSILTQNADAQRFRSSSRYCPQQVRYAPPSCPTVQYYVRAQPQMFARPFLPQTTMQQGFNCATQPATPLINAPQPATTIPMPTGNAAAAPVINDQAIQPATQTVDPVAPVPVPVKPILNSPATVEPVPTGDTQIAPATEVPPAAEPPKAPSTTTGAKSILDKGK